MGENLRRLIRWENPRVSDDGRFIEITAVLAGENVSMAIPVAEIGDMVALFASLSDFVVSHAVPAPDGSPPRTSSETWEPVAVRGVGMAQGRTPDETLLVAFLSGFELAFSLDSTKLTELGHDLSRALLLSSARLDKPN